jgi:hypothetical protein
LGCPHRGRAPLTFCHHPCLPPLTSPLQDPALADPPGDEPHQQLMVAGVNEACDLDCSHGPMRDEWCVDDLHRGGGPTPWATAGRGGLAVGCHDRRDHDLTRLWPHPLPDGRHPARSLPSVRFGAIDPPPRRRPGAPSPSGWLARLEKGGHARRLDVCSPDPVDAGTAPMRSDFPPGPPPPSRPEDAVVERRQSAMPAPLGRLGSRALEWS